MKRDKLAKPDFQNRPERTERKSSSVIVQLGLVLAAIAIFAGFSRRDGSTAYLEWWQTTIVYQIYPRSFKDSDGDGIGDLRGITSKLDYFQYLNVKAIWLSPFYISPMKDFGYDISNHTDVDPVFGTLADFDDMLWEAHARDIKIIIDFVPNHTSDKHVWFQESLKGSKKYTDYFIWDNGKKKSDGKRTEPNNWLGIFSGSAWEWNKKRGQYYYHAFLREQPDLNYRNPAVVEDMKNVLRFWLDRGVDGIRVDAISKLFEIKDLTQDEPRSNKPKVPPLQYEYLFHPHTENLPETIDVVQGWRDVMKEYEQRDGIPRFMVIETYDPPKQRNVFYTCGAVPFNFDLVEGMTPKCGGSCLRAVIDDEYSNLPSGAWPKFVLGNHDRKRVSKRFGSKFVNAYNMLLLTLRGTPTTYYGEEIGMEEIEISYEDTQDPWGLKFGKDRYSEFSRDPVRSAMQWDATPQAGFTSSPRPWLPVHSNYKTVNVEAQKKSKSKTPIQLYRELARLREKTSFQNGDIQYAVVDTEIFSFVRKDNEFESYLVAINFSHNLSQKSYTAGPVHASRGYIITNTGNFESEKYNPGQLVDLHDITLRPGQGLVIKL